MAHVDYRLNPNGVQNSIPGTGGVSVLSFGDLATGGVSDFLVHNSLVLPDANYLLTLVVPWPYNASGVLGSLVYRNGAQLVGAEQAPQVPSTLQTLSTLVEGGGTFQFKVYQNSGVTKNFVGSYVVVQTV